MIRLNKADYFPNLNGLRAIGALIVMVGHIEFLKSFWDLPTYVWFPIPGKIGVTLFFSLSGYLITTLLLRESAKIGTVKLKEFYVRRILRIWPLYYLIVILGLFVLNNIEFLKIPVYSDNLSKNITPLNLVIVFFILPNFTNFFIPYADQRWSIVIEEQFYLLQPLLIKFFKNIQRLFLVFLIIFMLPDVFDALVKYSFLSRHVSANLADSIIGQLKYLACIATGCIFAIIAFTKNTQINSFLFNRYTQIITILLILLFLFLGKYVYNQQQVIDYRLYTILFSIVVHNAAQNPTTIFRLETAILNFLGKISYGIYMYHPVCIGFAISLAIHLGVNIWTQNLIIYSVSIALTIFISWVSFNYFEKFFLSLKSKIIRPKLQAPQ